MGTGAVADRGAVRPQVEANGYVAEVEVGDGHDGRRIPLVTSPVQFDETPGHPTRAPEHGEHTEAVLLGLGLTWDELTAPKAAGTIL